MNRRLETVTFRDCIYSQDCLYFFSSMYTLPMKMNLITNKIDVLPVYSKGKLREKTIDLEVSLGRNMYVLDMTGQYLIKYDIDTYESSCYEIDCLHSADGNFAFMGVRDNNMYIFTREAGKLVVFDAGKEEVKIVAYPDVEKGRYICGCKMGDSFFIFPQDGGQVLEYVAGDNIWRVRRLQESLKRCVHVAVSDDKIFILLADGTVFQWDVKNENLKKIDYDLQVYTGQDTAGRICCVKDYIIILPSLAQDIIRIDRNSYRADVHRDYPPDFVYDPDRKQWSKYYGYCENDTEYYFACRTNEYILKVEKQNGKFSWIKSQVDEWEFEKVRLEKESIIREKEGYLEWFITREEQQNTERKISDIGENIWETMQR